MNDTNEKIMGDYSVNENLRFRGQIVGTATVQADITLILEGQITKNLILQKDSTAYLHGTVSGDVINNGGHLEVFGVINGSLVEKGGITVIDSNAIVKGK